MEQPVEFPKKREVLEIITESFRFIGAEAGSLMKYTLIYALPFIIILAALQLVLSSEVTAIQETLRSMEPEEMLGQLGPMYKKYFLIMLFNVFVQSLFIAVIYTYIHAYLDRGKGNFTSSEITSAFFTNAWISIGTSLVVALISFIGLIFCIFPGIYILNSLSLAVFIAIYEKKGIGYAISRSWNLVKLQWWGTFLLNLVGFMLAQAAAMILSAPATMGLESKVLFTQGETISQAASDWRVWVFLVATIIGTLLSVVTFVFLAFQYFSLKEREKEILPGVN
jgi:hypothetical protein